MKYPRHIDIGNSYICACGHTVNEKLYFQCRRGYIHQSKDKTKDKRLQLLEIANGIMSTDSNIIDAIYLHGKGFIFQVYHRRKFFQDYRDRDWIDLILVTQKATTIYDLTYPAASPEDMNRISRIYVRESSMAEFYKVILKIRSKRGYYYRESEMTSIDIYHLYKRGELEFRDTLTRDIIFLDAGHK